MNTKQYCFALLVITLCVVSCATQKNTVDIEKMAKLEQMVKTRNFQIDARWASPMATRSMTAIANAGLLAPGNTTNRIDINGVNSYLRVQNDSVFAELPYYGEIQLPLSYNPGNSSETSGIHFIGLAKDFSVEFNQRRQDYEFNFEVVNKNGEGFDVNGTLGPDLAATIWVNSSHRFSIRYIGSVSESGE